MKTNIYLTRERMKNGGNCEKFYYVIIKLAKRRKKNASVFTQHDDVRHTFKEIKGLGINFYIILCM